MVLRNWKGPSFSRPRSRYRAPESRRGVLGARHDVEPHGGLRYVFPAQLGETGKGVPTSIGGSPALSAKLLVGDEDHVVWPAKGRAARVRGRTLAPLYRTVPQAAADDPLLHEYLALTDALRVGRARERALAKEELSKRLAS